jgi:hypothetical protein
MNCACSTRLKLSAASRIAPGATIGAALRLEFMSGTPAMKTVAAAIVITNLRMMTSQGFTGQRRAGLFVPENGKRISRANGEVLARPGRNPKAS